jgi:hypothetical protein
MKEKIASGFAPGWVVAVVCASGGEGDVKIRRGKISRIAEHTVVIFNGSKPNELVFFVLLHMKSAPALLHVHQSRSVQADVSR